MWKPLNIFGTFSNTLISSVVTYKLLFDFNEVYLGFALFCVSFSCFVDSMEAVKVRSKG